MKTAIILIISSICSALAGKGIFDQSPTVKIVSPEDKKVVGWNAQVRYEISVSDPKDGDTKYGEINGSQCLMEVSFLPGKPGETAAAVKKLQAKEEHPGLALIRTSNCFGCHSDKTRLAGPSFAEIAKKYQANTETLKSISTRIVEGSTGIWGSLEMPAHPELNIEQGKLMAQYILEQGKNERQWVYAGLEGMVKIAAKPANASEGVYVLTASYISSSKLRGHHSIILSVK